MQKSYTVYAAHAGRHQQQLAVFDLARHHLHGDRRDDAGAGPAAGHQSRNDVGRRPRSPTRKRSSAWFTGSLAQPTNVSQSAKGVFQFQVTDANNNTTLYDILYTPGGNANMVKVDVPALLPTFTQIRHLHVPPSLLPAYLRNRRLQRVHHLRDRNRDAERELLGRVQHAGDLDRFRRSTR